MATSAQYVDNVWFRLTKGAPQPAAGIWRVAIQSTLNAALQRLGDRVAADDGIYPTLFHQWSLTLVGGEVDLVSQSPVILLSESARQRWRITMTSVTYSLQFLPNMHDLENPPPTSDFYFYTVFNRKLIVRDSGGAIPSETAVQLYANQSPEITDANLTVAGQLYDNLIDIGVAMMLETSSLAEVIRQAETPSQTTEALAQPTG